MAREVTIRYLVGQENDDERGNLLGGNQVPIVVDGSYHQREESDLGITLVSHQHYLKTLFINNEADFTDRIHESFTHNLSTYLHRLGRITRKWSFERHGISYVLVKAGFKKIYKAMVEFVAHMHSIGVAFTNAQTLSIDENFGVCGGVLKFWKVEFCRTSLVKARRNDYELVAGVIESHILSDLSRTQRNVIPDFFEDLISRMRQYELNDDYLLTHHVALQSDCERLVFMQNLTNRRHLLYARSVQAYEDALALLGNKSGWLYRLQQPCFWPILLNLKLRHFKDPTTVNIQPGTPPYVARLRTIYTDGGGPLGIVSRDDQIAINLSILKMCRNLSTHLAETNFKVRLNAENVAGMILHTFGSHLVEFERILARKQILKFFFDGA